MTASTPPRILIVDDEIQVGKALRRLLTRRGYAVEIAEDPSTALARLEEVAPDIVLSDYRMPGMSGVELLGEIQRRRPAARRFLLSGYVDGEVAGAARESGVIDGTIEKPWDEETLLAKLAGEGGERHAA